MNDLNYHEIYDKQGDLYGSMGHRDDTDIIWQKKIFIIDIHNEVFTDLKYG